MGKVKRLIFLGSGTSGSVPNIHCLIEKEVTCKVCRDALQQQPAPSSNRFGKIEGLSAPHFSKNRRRNTSAVIQYLHSDGTLRNILIDCGKSFYESALTWFVEYRLRNIDAVLLTHGHADAMMGLDDLRQWTIGGEEHTALQDVVPIYLGSETMQVVSRSFPYMVDRSTATGGGDVPAVQFHVIEEGSDGQPVPFRIGELDVIPFAVEHGKVKGGAPYYAYGFRFEDVTYVSDVSKFPAISENRVQDSKLLVIDGLRPTPHASHFSFQEALDVSLHLIAPGGHGLLTGLTHAVDHDDVNIFIEENSQSHRDKGIKMECAYDGMVIEIS